MFTRKHGRKPRVCIVPLSVLRRLPADLHCRVAVADYQIFPGLNPNDLPRSERFISRAYLTVGSDFRVRAGLVRGAGGWLLELSPDAYDMARRMPQTLTLTTALLGSIYVAIVRAHVAEQASQYGRSREGRN